MAQTPKRLASTELTTGSADLYTAPANTRTRISSAYISNDTATPRYATLTLTPSGGSATDVTYQVVVPAAGSGPLSLYWLVNQTFNPGDKISGLAEANSALTIQLSGIESAG